MVGSSSSCGQTKPAHSSTIKETLGWLNRMNCNDHTYKHTHTPAHSFSCTWIMLNVKWFNSFVFQLLWCEDFLFLWLIKTWICLALDWTKQEVSSSHLLTCPCQRQSKYGYHRTKNKIIITAPNERTWRKQHLFSSGPKDIIFWVENILL